LLIDSLGCRKTAGFNFSSALVGITNNSSLIEFNLYPNPTNNSAFNIDVELNKQENISVEVFNVNGQLVTQKQINAQSGKSTLPITVPNTSKGIYFVKLSSGSETIVKKITFM